MQKGKFITFEGGEGTGKSTQIKLLAAYLEKCGIKTMLSKDPGGTEIGLELRRILRLGRVDAVAERTRKRRKHAQLVRINLTQKVWPAMERGVWAVNDRFADSTVAYQYYGYDKKIPLPMLQELYTMAVGGFKPDLTILLDLDPEVGLARSMEKNAHMSVQETRHESRGLEFHQRLRRGYLEIAEQEPERIVVLNADKSIEELHRDVVKIVSERFGLDKCPTK